jgi:hypothetical protein
MKKLITSAGLVALGAAGLQAQAPYYAPAPGLTRVETTKPWSVSATLRGFYDDNYVTRPQKRDSFGIEISPAVGLNLTTPQTYVGASYVYGMRYYENRPRAQADHTHQANAKLTHAFTEQYRIDLSNSFVAAQEPEVLAPVGGVLIPIRAEGDNIRNFATGTLTANWTEYISTVLGYSNTLWDYNDQGPGSRSAILDRMEHLATANLRWQVMPTTVAVLGYQFGVTDFTGNEFLSPAGIGFRSSIRDTHTHYAFVGVDQAITSQISASIRGGAQYTIYRNVPDWMRDEVVSPYVDANATYAYGPANFAQLGVRHTRAATDIAFFNATVPTMDQEVTAVYGSVTHQITPGFVASLLAQYQHATFEGGGAHRENENYLITGLNLSYDINPFLTAEVGYNFDWLDSDLNRGFTRNRVYVGIRASY